MPATQAHADAIQSALAAVRAARQKQADGAAEEVVARESLRVATQAAAAAEDMTPEDIVLLPDGSGAAIKHNGTEFVVLGLPVLGKKGG